MGFSGVQISALQAGHSFTRDQEKRLPAASRRNRPREASAPTRRSAGGRHHAVATDLRQLAHEAAPVLTKVAAQLADPRRRNPKHAGHTSGRFTTGQCLGELPITRRQRLEPIRKIDPRFRDFRRARRPVFDQSLAPLSGPLIEPVEAFDCESLRHTPHEVT